MDYNVDLFSSLAADDSDKRVAHRKSLAVANKRVSDRFGAFLAAANTPDDYSARLDLIRADVREAVASVCNEHGGDPDRIERSIYSHLADRTATKEHMKGVGDKRNRQYEHVLESCKESHSDWDEDRCKEYAARTVNKTRSEKGETKDSAYGDVFPDPEGNYPGNESEPQPQTVNIEPDWEGMRRWVEALKQTDPETAAKIEEAMGNEAPSAQHYNPEDYPQDYSSPGIEFGGEAGSYLASVRTARRPKMCPYHREVTDISLASGDPTAGFNAMSQHAWGEQHCQGAFEGNCNFKPAMVTQKYWDDKAEQAAERRERREQERAEQIQQEQQITEVEVPDSPEGLEDSPAPVEEGSLNAELAEAPSAVGEGLETSEPVSDMGSLEPMAASNKTALTAKDFVLIADAIATSHIEDKVGAAQHFAGYLANTNPNFDSERFIAAATGEPTTGRDNYRGPDPVVPYNTASYNKEGEALKTIDVEQPVGPSPKIDKSKIPADGLPDIKTEEEGSPHPTKTIDPLVPVHPQNDEADFLEGTKAVTEKQDVEQSSSFDGNKADSGSWKGNNGASPVTSTVKEGHLTSSVDPDKNPIIDMLQSGFVPQAQVDRAIDEWNQQ